MEASRPVKINFSLNKKLFLVPEQKVKKMLVTIHVVKPGSDGSDISVEIEGLSDDEAETANLIGRRKAQILLFSTFITDIYFHEIIIT